MKKSKGSKIVSVALSLCLASAFAPSSALAAGEAEGRAQVQQGTCETALDMNLDLMAESYNLITSASSAGAYSGLSNTVRFTPVSGANSYSLWRFDTPSSTPVQVASTWGAMASSLTDNTCTAYATTVYYVVGVHNSTGALVAQSTNIALKTAPAQVTQVSYSYPGNTSIKLSWPSVPGADGYLVERCNEKVLGNAKYTTIKTLVGNGSTSYTDSGLPTKAINWYRVSAYCNNGTAKSVGSSSDEVGFLATGPDKTAITSIALNSNSQSNGFMSAKQSVSLRWNDTINRTSYYEKQAKGYYIQRSTNKKDWKTIATVYGNTTAYTDSSVEVAKTYYYRVVPFNWVNPTDRKVLKAAPSSVKSIKTLPKPGNIKSFKKLSKSKIRLGWNKVAGADGYILYCSTSKLGGQWKAGKVMGKNARSITVSGLASGSRYYFFILPVVKNGGATSYGTVNMGYVYDLRGGGKASKTKM